MLHIFIICIMVWDKKIQIEKNWVDDELTHHFTEEINDKLSMRIYTIIPSSTDINFLSLGSFLTRIIPQYVNSKKQIDDRIKRSIKRYREKITIENPTLSEKEIEDIINSESQRITNETISLIFNESRKFFKKKTEDQIGGKYGELLLFALVEGVLGCKMIAHKITKLTNVHDEVKGSDGIFIGNYKGNEAILIGESKVMQQRSTALDEALESLDRFHSDSDSASVFSHELFIARSDIHKFNDGTVDIDELYDRLDPDMNAYKKRSLVHPVMVMYESKKIESLKKTSSNQQDFLEKIKKTIQSKLPTGKEAIIKLLNEKVSDLNLDHVFFDFFLIPVDNVERFRNTMDNELL